MRIILLALAFAAGSVSAAVACPYGNQTAKNPETIAQADQATTTPSTKIVVPREDG